jgi:succinylglutamic semialdehyde dehydrogenase
MTADPQRELVSHSPWDGAEVARVPVADARQIDAVFKVLAGTFPVWAPYRRKSKIERLRDLAAACVQARAEIVDLLIREAGKVRSDAEAEADLLPKKIAVTIDQGLPLVPGVDDLIPAMPPGPIAWRPRGVAVVLGPFNFPLHLLHGLVVPALAVGCTVVAKPSERCPGLGELYRRLIAQAKLDAVCAVVQGGAEVAAALIAHPAAQTVAAVGGRAMGMALARLLAPRPEVVLALELGGVNHAMVLPDAPDTALAMVAEGAWRMAGQRCTATRVLHVPQEKMGDWLAGLQRERQRWRGDGTPAGTNGPMISVAGREAFQAPYRGLPRVVDQTGLTIVAGDATGTGAFADPLLLVAGPDAGGHPLIAEERFGPALVLWPFADEEQAIARMCANPYRLAASIFTADAWKFTTIARQLPYGQVNHNRPTAGARSDLPFGGCGMSGNGRPAAVSAVRIFADETVIWPASS